MNNIQIPRNKIQEGLDVLKNIQKLIPGAALAGGYLRDAVLGGKPKDIDIFIPHDSNTSIDAFMKVFGANELHGAKYMPQNEVTRIWDIPGHISFAFESENRLPVQIIMLNEGLVIQDRIKQYDYGLCQIWTFGEKVFITEDFLEDVKNNTCTLICCEDEVQFTRSLKRFNRFKERYPNLMLRIHQGVKDALTLQYSDC